MSERYASLHSNTSGLTDVVVRAMPGFAATAARICAVATVPTENVLVSAIGVSRTPSSPTWRSPTLLPKPLTTAAAAGTFSRKGSPPCGWMTVTPVWTSPRASVQWPTVTPATSAMVAREPCGRMPIRGPALKAVGSSSPLDLGVEGIAQAVAQQVEREHGDEDRDCRKDGDVRRHEHVGARGVEHRAPLGGRRLRAHAEERQARGGDDRRADPQREIDDHGGDGPGKDVARDDGAVVGADAPRRLDVREVLERERVPADEPREGRDAEDGDGDDHVRHAATEDRDDADREQDPGEREQHVADAHDDPVGPALVEAGDQSEHGADERPVGDRDEAGGERDPRTHQDPAEDVAAERIDAEEVLPRRRRVEPVVVEIRLGVVRHHPRGDDR